MRTKLAQIYEVVKTYLKASEATKVAAANVTAEAIAKEAFSAGKRVVVAQIEFGSDGKVARKIHEKLKAVYPDASYFIASFDEETDK